MVALKRLLANIYVYIRTLLVNHMCWESENNSVLIIADGLIGDTILIQDFLKEACRYFHDEKGYSVDLFISKPVVSSFYTECCETYGINLLPFHFQKKNTELLDLLHVLKCFKGKKYSIILNPHPKHKGDKLVGCLRANNKYAVRSDLHIEGKSLNNKFREIAYTKTIEVPLEEMEFERYKKLLGMAGDISYKTAQPVLKQSKVKMNLPEKYCVFACGASETGKKWDEQNFVEIASVIQSQYNLPIVFVGGKEDSEVARHIIDAIKESPDCYDLTGKTSFSQWVEIIRGSQLVIGNDSASVHIAAATSTKSICIVGKWQYKRFYPYILDHKNDFCPRPVFCKEKLPCENCGKVIELMPNKECQNAVKRNEAYECIRKVAVDQVLQELKNTISL